MFLLKNNVRKEIKFKVFIKDIGKFYSWLLNSPFKKSYENRRVNSLYYDTYNLDFANDNITGLSKRIKIRARWYSKYDQNFLNDFCKDKNFKFEVKRKVNNLSDKVFLLEASCNKEDTFLKRQNFLKKKLNQAISNYSIISKLLLRNIIFVGYKREYYQHFFSPNIRLTIDKDIACSISNQLPNSKKPIISNNYIIVEFKFEYNMKKLVTQLLKNFPFRRIRSSKYLYALSKYYRFSY